MTIPQTFSQVVIFLVLVVPGITFATVRVARVGVRSPDFGVGARILEALFVSAIFDAAYVLLFGGFVSDVLSGRVDPVHHFVFWQAAVAVLLLIVVPAAVAWLVSLRLARVPLFDKDGTPRIGADGARRLGWRPTNNYNPVPTAWDRSSQRLLDGQFVRVRTEGGTYYGGWFSGASYMSTYPQPRDLFIESEWRMGPGGEFFEELENTRGIWVPVTDKTIVEWIEK